MMASEISDGNVITSLKIQVDNDISHNNSAEILDDEVEEGEATGSDSEDEVVVNVIVDSQSADSHKLNYAHNVKETDDITKQEKIGPKSNRESLRNYRHKDSYYKPRRGSLTYSHLERHIPSIEQDFGSDMLSPIGVAEQKLEKRALRFGVTMSNAAISKSDWLHLWKSLDLTQDDFHRGGFRVEAIHMRGIENLRSNEIFEYFKTYNPDNIEWLNNESCNVVFAEKENAVKALIGLSCPIIDNTKKVNKNVKEVRSKTMIPKPSAIVSPTEIKSIKKVKKKDENKKSGSESDSSSDDSSSSDSEDDGSSSDSSSSSSTDSSSSSSNSESSSSSSSDTSDSEDENDTQNGNDKQETNNNTTTTTAVRMEIDNSEEQLGTVSVEEVGVSLPPGRWRLGVPCPNAKALLLRYAHCKDKKMPGIEKPVDFYEEYINIRRSNKALEQERHRIQKELIDLDRRHRRKNYDDKKPKSRRTHSKKERIEEKPAMKDVAGKYVDLDNPYDDGKNPWGFLAQNWDKKETQDSLDYQALLHQHITGQKRKRESDTDSDCDEYRHPAHKISSKRSHRYKKSLSEEDFYSYSEEESDEHDDFDDGVDWRSKITMPRMKMYADAEEKRKVKRDVEVRKRIRRNSKGREMRSRVHFPVQSLQLKQPGFDLRAILQSKNLRKREINFHPNSDGE